MRYSNHEYWCPRFIKVVLAFVGLCLFVGGAYFGNRYSGISNEVSIIYRKALTDKMSVDARMMRAEDGQIEKSTEAYQSLVREQERLNEVAKNAIEKSHRFDSKANRFVLLSILGTCILLAPILFYLIRVPKFF